MQRLLLLLCVGLFAAFAWQVNADDKRHHGSHHGHTHHYNSHYHGHSSRHHYTRNYDHYDPRIGYYDGYYNDYPVYAPTYRGRSYYPHSNYGISRHHTLHFQLFIR